MYIPWLTLYLPIEKFLFSHLLLITKCVIPSYFVSKNQMSPRLGARDFKIILYNLYYIVFKNNMNFFFEVLKNRLWRCFLVTKFFDMYNFIMNYMILGIFNFKFSATSFCFTFWLSSIIDWLQILYYLLFTVQCRNSLDLTIF